MSILKKTKWLWYYLVCLFTIRLGIYYAYSRLVTWIFQYKFRNGVPPVKEYTSYTELLHEARGWKWIADTWREGWDSFSYPSYVQHRLNTKNYAIGDCDDWSLYLGTVFEKLEAKSPIFDSYRIGNIQVLTICSFDTVRGEFAGHNVCLLELMDRYHPEVITYAHSSNWGKGAIQMSTVQGKPYNSIGAVVSDICKTMSGDYYDNLGWAVCDLKVRFTGKSGRLA